MAAFVIERSRRRFACARKYFSIDAPRQAQRFMWT
jgi:hypothetical protein